MKLILPLHYTHALTFKPPKKIAYSLNNFTKDLSNNNKKLGRSCFYEHAAKKHIQKIAKQQLKKFKSLDCSEPLMTVLVIYRGSNTCVDIDNFSIIHKFVADVIKDEHIIDDNYKYLNSVLILDGGLDRENPRAELSVDNWENILQGCSRAKVLSNLASEVKPDVEQNVEQVEQVEYDLDMYD